MNFIYILFILVTVFAIVDGADKGFFFPTENIFRPSPELLNDFLKSDHKKLSPHQLFVKTISKVYSLLSETINPTSHRDDYPYYDFLPRFAGAVLPNQQTELELEGCYESNTVSSVLNVDGSLNITFSFKKKTDWTELFCHDLFMLGTVDGLMFVEVKEKQNGQYTTQWVPPNDATADEQWDLTTNGVRVFHFTQKSWEQLGACLFDTLELMTPLMEGPTVHKEAAKLNMEFLQSYANVNMTARSTPEVKIDESMIQSGDFLGIIRLDGLDPTLAWAMGSTTGHTALTLRDPDTNELFVVESTATTNYWKTNGIQKTPFDTWISLAKEASFQVVHAPLSTANAAKFDVVQAWKFFHQTEGLNYGYYNMIFGWIDTIKNNYPCLPPDRTKCLQFDLVEVIFGFLDRIVPDTVDLFWNQGWNMRLNTTGLRTASLYREAVRQGYRTEEVPAIPEDDSWEYSIIRNNGSMTKGPSMVCCVFACHIWKAGGLFESIRNEVNCGEATNFDDYSLHLFSELPPPSQCRTADPLNNVCQLEGEYTLNLNRYNSQDPYAHMHEKCPSEAPEYERPSNC